MRTTVTSFFWKFKVAIASVVLISAWGAARAFNTSSTTRAQAIAVVRSIINQNARSCRISKTNRITAVTAGRNWRVTARIVMSASGRPVNETAIWTVRSDREAVPANQLTAEISKGCP